MATAHRGSDVTEDRVPGGREVRAAACAGHEGHSCGRTQDPGAGQPRRPDGLGGSARPGGCPEPLAGHDRGQPGFLHSEKALQMAALLTYPCFSLHTF